MSITFDALMNYRIPPVRHRFTQRDSIFYALSVGMGQDPTDERQLRFLDHHKALLAMPAMAVVLAQPKPWIADPATGIDALKVVHGEQSFTLHGTLPTEGELAGHTRITGLVDKGPGRGALMYTEKTLVDGAGTVVATLQSTAFLRGDGGFGGPAGPVRPSPPAPQGEPAETVDLATRPEQALFYRLNGDDNPLHADPAFAVRAGFPRPILHGLCTLGVVAHAILAARCGYDPARLGGMGLRFSSPVYPGETIRTEIWPDNSFRARVLERDTIVVDRGHATVREQAA